MSDEFNEEIMYQILVAQAKNVARIETGLEVKRSTGQEETVQLFGPKVNLVRLYDQPVRFTEGIALDNWERMIFLNPLFDQATGRFANRDDRVYRYTTQFLLRLTEQEQVVDRELLLQDNLRTEHMLAKKAHRLVADFRHVFADNFHLIGDECPQGLVDDHYYTISWEPGIEWPWALMTAEVTASQSGQ